MQHLRINHSEDLKKLQNEGYCIEINGGHLFVHHIPYVNSRKEVKNDGILVMPLTLSSPKTLMPPNIHTTYFSGGYPHHKDGTPMTKIVNNANPSRVGGIMTQYMFSCKPPSGRYNNYHEKVETYTNLLCNEARGIDSSVTAKKFIVMPSNDATEVFQYTDTNASRANISHLNDKFKGQKIGIIGLGGTGSYILDFAAKTPVSEIHLFDHDDLYVHNAFRCPGAINIDTLNRRYKKVEYLSAEYSKLHKGIKAHTVAICYNNIELLKDLSFVFVSVDSDMARRDILTALKDMRIPCVDVGMSIIMADNQLLGTIRTTTITSTKNDHVKNRINFVEIEGENAEYQSNIQIAELNAFNAVLAIMKWKKQIGFYQDFEREHHSTYDINTAQLLNDEKIEA